MIILVWILRRAPYPIRIHSMRVFSLAFNCHSLPAVLLLMVVVIPGQVSLADPAESVPNCAAESKNCTAPDDAALESMGAVIGNITFVRENVFDLTKPSENKALYRLANRWHVVTRESVVLSQLLFREGDPYSRRILDESERLLRRNAYIYDAQIMPSRFEDGVVDIVVRTRDVWTLSLDVSVSRTGGENKARIGLAEQNLLGQGTTVRLSFEDNVDREPRRFGSLL